MEDNHIISSTKKLIDALKQLNSFRYDPLVLFVVDEDYKMVGTITDGDARRALISGKSVYDKLETFMHRNFKFLQKGIDDDVAQGLTCAPNITDADLAITEVWVPNRS